LTSSYVSEIDPNARNMAQQMKSRVERSRGVSPTSQAT